MISIHTQNPRLWEEQYDPIEFEVYDDYPIRAREVLPEEWRLDFIVQNRLPETQRDIMNAYLDGLCHTDMGITEKKFRYHMSKAVKSIKKIIIDKSHLYELNYDLLKENVQWQISSTSMAQ